MDIVVDKDKIFKDAKMNISIIGRSLKDENGNSLFDKIQLQDRDDDLLSMFFDSAFGNILNGLNNFIESCSGNIIKLVDNRRFNENSIIDIPKIIHNYIVDFIIAEWLKIKAVEFASIYTEKVALALSTVLEKLRIKTEPVKKIYNE